MKDCMFITGATGFLGTEIVDQLVRNTNYKIYVLVRAQNQEQAYHRLKASWHHSRVLYDKIGELIFPVVGDFTKPNLGMEEDAVNQLYEEVNLIFHSGAEVNLQKTGEELDCVNREGTQHVVEFAKGVKNLQRLVFISTAYVAGQQKGRILEVTHKGQSFSTLYEKSKAEAEEMVQNSSLPWSICRPGMIVGHSKTGRIKNFNTIYYVLKLMLTGKMPILPVKKEMGLNLVPVDYVAECAIKIGCSKEGENRIFHLTCPKDMQPKAGELAEYVSTWAKSNLGLELKKPVFASVSALKKAGLSYNEKTDGKKKTQLTNLLALLPYFYGGQEFDRTHTDALMGAYPFSWKEYIDPLLAFACAKNFMHQTERTVFEQANVRRDSKKYPIHYYDVKSDGIRKLSGERVNRRIRKIQAAMWALGIRRGDRVALTGINCIDYMMVDQAIGLLGAVSVPIYYTTPMDEASLLLNKSGAKWFFIGDKRMMEGISELTADIPIIVFSAAQDYIHSKKENDIYKSLDAKVMDWQQFLSKGKRPAPLVSPDPDDLATIRYTSGTTGEPKGVMFHYHQLAWMGEVLTNLLSWKGRNREMRYLSFLPESHVVEGILASYAPYYMLAKVDFYFLNDFGSLVDALPKVRPTVFFSVPRFYEKLWDQLTANKIGKQYLSMKEGPAKRALAAVLRKVILKKAGLDACEQLIVGSAPMSEALLRNFRELGIEIHNAYGQTEAPLITINRLGDNVIPTIGTPLPETKVSVAEDGELIVTGPQVCMGYYGLETDTVQNGVLKTGDLGSIDENGHIMLFGRKKEMIITAYGKNISIPKIEERLKNIPGVSEAVLIGENRPYCTALLWVEGNELNENTLEEKIQTMNLELSHPEQVKRYRVIEEPLSIQKGELTPNLKVKRANVELHYQKEIQEMYQ